MDDNSWSKTDVCPNYRNYARWIPVIQSGPGTKVTGLVFRQKGEVNGDSFPKIIGKQPDMLGEKPAEPIVKKQEPKQETLL